MIVSDGRKTNRPFKGDRFRKEYISISAQICFLFIYPARVPWMVCHSSFDFWWWSCSSTTYWTGVGMTLPLDRTSTYSWQKFMGHDEAGISIYFHVSHTLKWISTGYISIIPPKKRGCTIVYKEWEVRGRYGWRNPSISECSGALFSKSPLTDAAQDISRQFHLEEGQCIAGCKAVSQGGWSSKVCKIHSSISQTLLCIFEGLIKNYQGHNSSIQT